MPQKVQHYYLASFVLNYCFAGSTFIMQVTNNNNKENSNSTLSTFNVFENCLNSYGIQVTDKGQLNNDDDNKGNDYNGFWSTFFFSLKNSFYR